MSGLGAWGKGELGEESLMEKSLAEKQIEATLTAIGQLCAESRQPADMMRELAKVFNKMGDVRRVSQLDGGAMDHVFLVDFASSMDALLVANMMGYRRLGFHTVVVDLQKPLRAQ